VAALSNEETSSVVALTSGPRAPVVESLPCRPANLLDFRTHGRDPAEDHRGTQSFAVTAGPLGTAASNKGNPTRQLHAIERGRRAIPGGIHSRASVTSLLQSDGN